MERRTTRSPWMEVPVPAFPAITRDLSVDVVVVGGGVTGITTAYLLKQQGVKVALVERDRLAGGDSARTTAHLTYVTDQRLHRIARQFGEDAARTFWDAGRAAINQIGQLAREVDEDVGFKRVPGYLHCKPGPDTASDVEELQADLDLARTFGFEAEFVAHPACSQGPGICFQEQARLHPRKYLAALARQIPGNGSHVFENTAFEKTEESPFVVVANQRRISCEHLVIATHNPLMGNKGAVASALFQTKLALYTSYVLGARLPHGTLPEALFWDTRDPYDYLRVDEEEGQYAIFGGEDVKTGQEDDTTGSFRRLEERLLARLPMARVEDRWLGQVIETDDGLPFIGENAERQFIATGFAGNGFTFGTLGAVMARDWHLGRPAPWQDLFKVDRKPFHGGVWRYVTENADYPYYFLRDRLASLPAGIEALKRGEGKLVEHEGHKVAAYRDSEGRVTLCSPVCTHMKCLVRWNASDRTWDCPCHGSRFRCTGEVLSGPAESDLQRLDAAAS